ncbi:hypothetical protein [Fibrella arboris]|uniref:hypothetical protein n=1 Tax=Fibrella arboris TaxID=3242486 RepID=UPI00352118B3
MKSAHLVLALLFGVLVASCSTEKWVNNQVGPSSLNKRRLDSTTYSLGKNLVAGGNSEVSHLVVNLIKSLKASADTLDPLDPLTRKVKRQIDSLGHLTNGQIDSIGLTVLTRVNELKREVQDEELKRFFLDAIDKAGDKVDKKTRPLLANMLGAALDSLTSSSGRAKLAAFRDSTLNEATQRKLQQTISTALEPTLDTLTARIRSIVHDDLPVVQKYATQFLLGLGGILSAIIGWVWYQRRRYAKLVQLLTNQIHRIPDAGSYDQLVQHIQRQAQQERLEPLLRETLSQQGINQDN